MDRNTFEMNGHVFHSGPEFIALSQNMSKLANYKIKEISKLRLAPVADIIYITTGFEPITTDLNCGGYFDSQGKKIALSSGTKRGFEIFCHELGHWMHYELGIDYNKTELLSDQVRFEHEAEAAGKMIFEAVTQMQYKNVTYFNPVEIEWLADWYGDWFQNDLKHD